MQRIAAVRRHLAEADPRATTDPTTPLAIGSAASGGPQRRPRVAAIVTAYFPQSHADVIVSKLVTGYVSAAARSADALPPLPCPLTAGTPALLGPDPSPVS